ncbi:MAG: ABC transporter ATP-binding protein [Myxococcales bacterium]|nr:ABC transporter ATP-binding protein [Myxococcales bacterium]
MIQIDHLTKRYGERLAVNDISFRVEPGEVIGFLGPNGAGKSTTLRMLTGYLTPNEGSIRIGDVDAIASPVKARKLIGYMPESVPLYREMRVEEYLRYRARLKQVPSAKRKAHIDKALELASVADVRDRIIGQLSKGYRSRVGLADALVADPPLLVLDEPTAGLDPNQIRQVRDLIRGMAGEKTVLLSTHILPEVESTCGRVLIINKGELVGEGEPGNLRAASEGQQMITVEARSAREPLEELLLKVEGVRSVADATLLSNDPPVTRLKLAADAGEITERIFSAIAEASLTLRELRRDEASLEDVFASLTTRDGSQDEAEESSEEPGDKQEEGGA